MVTLRSVGSVVWWEKVLNGVHSRENETARSGDSVENAFEKCFNKAKPKMGKKLEETRDQKMIPQ